MTRDPRRAELDRLADWDTAHSLMFPLCNRPLPHGHDLGMLPPDPDPRVPDGFMAEPVQPAPVRARYEFALAAFAAVIVIVAIALALATSRSASMSPPTASAQSGTPHAVGASRGVPNPPAVANVAISEGSSDLTSSMSATNPEYANRQSSGRVAPARDRTSEPHASVDGGSSPPSGSINAVTRQGVITHNDDATSRSYLALPCQRNGVHCRLLVRLCGPADCVELRQTDYGPSQRLHPDRIADVHPAMFERICGCPASRGVTVGTWTAITRHIPLPETDTLEAP